MWLITVNSEAILKQTRTWSGNATTILFRHRTEGSSEIALRLRELSVLPPLERMDVCFFNMLRILVLSNNSQKMPRTSDKGEKDNLKRKSSGSRSEHIEANVRIIERGDGADGAKTDSHGLQELAATLRQGFTQMSQDLSKTIAESFKQFQSDFEIQYVDTEEEQEAKSAENDHEVSEEPPTKKKRHDKTTSLEEFVSGATANLLLKITF